MSSFAKILSMSDFKNFNFKGKTVLVRVDFNVPLNKDTLKVEDNKRIRAALPTLQSILEKGGRVIILSHLGRPKNGPEEKFSLKHLIPQLEKLLNRKVFFASDCIGSDTQRMASKLKDGEILLLENIRFYKEETAGDIHFAEKIASLGDCFVNDAFGTAHRAHATTTIIADFFPENRMFGLLMQEELDNAEKVMSNAEKPLTAIVGGAKVSDKILIVENLLNRADHIIIGGGMAYTFFKALDGNIGDSLLENDRINTCKNILKMADEKGVQIHLPIDSIVADSFSNEANTMVSRSNSIPDKFMGLDIGPEAIKQFTEVLLKSKTILWNGPMGVFEMSSFSNGTKKIAEAIAKSSMNSAAYSLIGGGDSAAAIKKFGYETSVSYVSTGGGALLEYFEGKTLPGIKAILG